jgi:hypothetical protein
MPKKQSKRTISLLIAGLSICIAASATSTSALAQSCPATDALPDAALRDSTGTLKTEREVQNSCWAHLRGCTDSKKIQNCVADANTRIKGQVAKPIVKETKGVCSMATAKDEFFVKEPTFKAIHDDLTIAVAGLTNLPDPQVKGFRYESFGPDDNVPSQQANRAAALAQLKKFQERFKADVDLYSTLSSRDCFDCAVLEKFAVLKGAANLISFSWGFGADKVGVRVGVSANSSLLTATRDDDQENGSLLPGATPRRISQAADNAVSLDLNKIERQWLGALDGAYVQKLKDQICKLARATDSNAYRQGDTYFNFARSTQRIINELFDAQLIGEPARMTTYDTLATEASAGAKDKEPMSKVYTDFVSPKASAAGKAKCATSGLEFKAFHPEAWRDPDTQTQLPSWCK